MSHKFRYNRSTKNNSFREQYLVFDNILPFRDEWDSSDLEAPGKSHEQLEMIYDEHTGYMAQGAAKLKSELERSELLETLDEERARAGKSTIPRDKFTATEMDDIQLMVDVLEYNEPTPGSDFEEDERMDPAYKDYQMSKEFFDTFDDSDGPFGEEGGTGSRARRAIEEGHFRNSDKFKNLLTQLSINQQDFLDCAIGSDGGWNLEAGVINRNMVFNMSFLSKMKVVDPKQRKEVRQFHDIADVEGYLGMLTAEKTFRDMTPIERENATKLAQALRDILALCEFIENIEYSSTTANDGLPNAGRINKLNPDYIREDQITFANNVESIGEIEEPEIMLAVLGFIYGDLDTLVERGLITATYNRTTNSYDITVNRLDEGHYASETFELFPDPESKARRNYTFSRAVHKIYSDVAEDSDWDWSWSESTTAGFAQLLKSPHFTRHQGAILQMKYTIGASEDLEKPAGSEERIQAEHELAKQIANMIAPAFITGPIKDGKSVTHEEKYGDGTEADEMSNYVSRQIADKAIYENILKASRDNETQTFSLEKMATYLQTLKESKLAKFGLGLDTRMAMKYRKEIADIESHLGEPITADRLRTMSPGFSPFEIDLMRASFLMEDKFKTEIIEGYRTLGRTMGNREYEELMHFAGGIAFNREETRIGLAAGKGVHIVKGKHGFEVAGYVGISSNGKLENFKSDAGFILAYNNAGQLVGDNTRIQAGLGANGSFTIGAAASWNYDAEGYEQITVSATVMKLFGFLPLGAGVSAGYSQSMEGMVADRKKESLGVAFELSEINQIEIADSFQIPSRFADDFDEVDRPDVLIAFYEHLYGSLRNAEAAGVIEIQGEGDEEDDYKIILKSLPANNGETYELYNDLDDDEDESTSEYNLPEAVFKVYADVLDATYLADNMHVFTDPSVIEGGKLLRTAGSDGSAEYSSVFQIHMDTIREMKASLAGELDPEDDEQEKDTKWVEGKEAQQASTMDVFGRISYRLVKRFEDAWNEGGHKNPEGEPYEIIKNLPWMIEYEGFLKAGLIAEVGQVNYEKNKLNYDRSIKASVATLFHQMFVVDRHHYAQDMAEDDWAFRFSGGFFTNLSSFVPFVSVGAETFVGDKTVVYYTAQNSIDINYGQQRRIDDSIYAQLEDHVAAEAVKVDPTKPDAVAISSRTGEIYIGHNGETIIERQQEITDLDAAFREFAEHYNGPRAITELAVAQALKFNEAYNRFGIHFDKIRSKQAKLADRLKPAPEDSLAFIKGSELYETRDPNAFDEFIANPDNDIDAVQFPDTEHPGDDTNLRIIHFKEDNTTLVYRPGTGEIQAFKGMGNITEAQNAIEAFYFPEQVVGNDLTTVDDTLRQSSYLEMSFSEDFIGDANFEVYLDNRSKGIHLTQMSPTTTDNGKIRLAINTKNAGRLIITQREIIKSDGQRTIAIVISEESVSLDRMRRIPNMYTYNKLDKRFNVTDNYYAKVEGGQGRDLITGEIVDLADIESTARGEDVTYDETVNWQPYSRPDEIFGEQPEELLKLSMQIEHPNQASDAHEKARKLAEEITNARGKGKFRSKGAIHKLFMQAYTLSFKRKRRTIEISIADSQLAFKRLEQHAPELLEKVKKLTVPELQSLISHLYVNSFVTIQSLGVRAKTKKRIALRKKRIQGLVKSLQSKYFEHLLEYDDHLDGLFEEGDEAAIVSYLEQQQINGAEAAQESLGEPGLTLTKVAESDDPKIQEAYYMSVTGGKMNVGGLSAQGLRMHDMSRYGKLQYLTGSRQTVEDANARKFVLETMDPIKEGMTPVEMQRSQLAMKLAGSILGKRSEVNVPMLSALIGKHLPEAENNAEGIKKYGNLLGIMLQDNFEINNLGSLSADQRTALNAFNKLLIEIRNAQHSGQTELTSFHTLSDGGRIDLNIETDVASMFHFPCGNAMFSTYQAITVKYQGPEHPDRPAAPVIDAFGAEASSQLRANSAESRAKIGGDIIVAMEVKPGLGDDDDDGGDTPEERTDEPDGFPEDGGREGFDDPGGEGEKGPRIPRIPPKGPAIERVAPVLDNNQGTDNPGTGGRTQGQVVPGNEE